MFSYGPMLLIYNCYNYIVIIYYYNYIIHVIIIIISTVYYIDSVIYNNTIQILASINYRITNYKHFILKMKVYNGNT